MLILMQRWRDFRNFAGSRLQRIPGYVQTGTARAIVLPYYAARGVGHGIRYGWHQLGVGGVHLRQTIRDHQPLTAAALTGLLLGTCVYLGVPQNIYRIVTTPSTPTAEPTSPTSPTVAITIAPTSGPATTSTPTPTATTTASPTPTPTAVATFTPTPTPTTTAVAITSPAPATGQTPTPVHSPIATQTIAPPQPTTVPPAAPTQAVVTPTPSPQTTTATFLNYTHAPWDFALRRSSTTDDARRFGRATRVYDNVLVNLDFNDQKVDKLVAYATARKAAQEELNVPFAYSLMLDENTEEFLNNPRALLSRLRDNGILPRNIYFHDSYRFILQGDGPANKLLDASKVARNEFGVGVVWDLNYQYAEYVARDGDPLRTRTENALREFAKLGEAIGNVRSQDVLTAYQRSGNNLNAALNLMADRMEQTKSQYGISQVVYVWLRNHNDKGVTIGTLPCSASYVQRIRGKPVVPNSLNNDNGTQLNPLDPACFPELLNTRTGVTASSGESYFATYNDDILLGEMTVNGQRYLLAYKQ